jgi:cytochrome P450/NADPH-cytochrome P450 reductase
MGSTNIHTEPQEVAPPKSSAEEPKGTPITILYGSNTGTCEVFARTLAADARRHGFSASTVDTLDSAKRNFPKEPTIIVTASYEGEPPDNAAHFYNWLNNLPADEKVDANFAVFGCGHSDWKQTFHRIPKEIDRLLIQTGGQRICDMGSADAAKGDMMSDFQAWEDDVLWPALRKQFGSEESDTLPDTATADSLSVEVFSRRASLLRADVYEARVVSTKTLTAPGEPKKKHIELELPSNMTYRSGDYCAVLPLNPPETVHRVFARFGLPWDAMLKISSRTGTTLPTEHPTSAANLFAAYVELSQPATKRNLSTLLGLSPDAETTRALEDLSTNFDDAIAAKRVSLLDLLERFPQIHLPLPIFISSLIPMRVRQYSISSSPLSNPHVLTLTFAVLDAPSTAGTGRKHVGVASNYLDQLAAGDKVHMAIKPSHSSFHLPTTPDTTPVIMLAAGAGLAPFRGFIQERAAQIGSGRSLAPAHLFFGCRHPDADDLYRDELDFWERIGAVVVHRAYSRAPERAAGARHIDDAIRREKVSLWDLWDRGARVYVCGSKGLGESVKLATLEIARERERAKGNPNAEDDAHMEAWFEALRNERFATDVFA